MFRFAFYAESYNGYEGANVPYVGGYFKAALAAARENLELWGVENWTHRIVRVELATGNKITVWSDGQYTKPKQAVAA